MSSEHYFTARCTAGRAAVSLADSHGHVPASDTIRGLSHGFILADAEMNGADFVLHEIHQLLIAARVPSQVEKPKLKIINGG